MSQVRAKKTDVRAWVRANGSSLAILSLTVILGWGYTSTLLPGVGFSGDTAKFQFLGEILGIPHPTGYRSTWS